MEYQLENRICQNCKNDFTIEPDDFSFYEKIKVPPPTFCPECRLARKLAWRNERTLYKRNCDLCKKSIVSMHKPEAFFPVYCHECWWSDKWNPNDFGLDYTFSKSFFEQFNELQKLVPRPSMYSTGNLNSDYSNHTAHMKNGYLIFGSWFCENSSYGQTVMESKDCWDCIFTRKCEFCFYSSDITNCNNLLFSRQCNGCIDSAFLYDCRNCQNCLFSYNLRNKSYHVFNKPVTKEEFQKFKQQVFATRESLDKAKKDFGDLVREKAVHKFMAGEQNADVSGDIISNSKNVHKSYYIDNGENEKYAVRGGVGQKDAMDVFGTHAGELCYECNNIDFCRSCFFSVNGEHNIDTNYVVDCDHLTSSFGCISLRKNEYCILNKKYSKEEYIRILPKIIESMKSKFYIDERGVQYGYGEFFPQSISPFSYDETIAQEYFPLNKDKAVLLGYKWKGGDVDKSYTPTIKWNELPVTIEDTDDSIINDIILCEEWNKNIEQAKEHKCTKAFRITQNELVMYRKYNIPVPTMCPNSRYFDMRSKRNPVKFWHRKCMKEGCTNEFETSYAPDRPEIVYCEKCYQQEVY